jgi:hypothetical protein
MSRFINKGLTIPPLRCIAVTWYLNAVSSLQRRFKPPFDIQQNPDILHMMPNRFEQQLMIDMIKSPLISNSTTQFIFQQRLRVTQPLVWLTFQVKQPVQARFYKRLDHCLSQRLLGYPAYVCLLIASEFPPAEPVAENRNPTTCGSKPSTGSVAASARTGQ